MARRAASPRPSVSGRAAAPVRWPSPRYLQWRRLGRNPQAILGGLLIALVALAIAAAPLMPLADPLAIDSPRRLLPPGTPGNPLGTDDLGRDLLSRLVWGGRVSFLAGLGSALLAMSVGVVLGLLAGYSGGIVDLLVMRAVDVILAFPAILLAIALAAALGPGLGNAMLAVSFVGIPLYARLIRGSTLSIREREYVEAARVIGASGLRIAVRHILPNALPPVLVAGTLDVGHKIIATASLSFLGLGTQPPVPDWGGMLAEGRQFIFVAGHVATLPGLAIFVAVLGLNILGDGLRDALDPRLARQ